MSAEKKGKKGEQREHSPHKENRPGSCGPLRCKKTRIQTAQTVPQTRPGVPSGTVADIKTYCEYTNICFDYVSHVSFFGGFVRTPKKRALKNDADVCNFQPVNPDLRPCREKKGMMSVCRSNVA